MLSEIVRLGFEPRQGESESPVLPLHHRTVLSCLTMGLPSRSSKRKECEKWRKKPFPASGGRWQPQVAGGGHKFSGVWIEVGLTTLGQPRLSEGAQPYPWQALPRYSILYTLFRSGPLAHWSTDQLALYRSGPPSLWSSEPLRLRPAVPAPSPPPPSSDAKSRAGGRGDNRN